MSSGPAIRVEDEGAVRRLVLCRPEAYNTITLELRDELGAALDAADRDAGVRVVLLSAEGPAFCAGFGLDWSTASQARAEGAERVWDTVADVQMIGRFGKTFAKLHEISKPTVAAVQGWCVAGRDRHGPQRRPDRGRRGRPLRLPAGTGVGRPRGAVAVGRPARARARQALPVHRRRADGRRGGGGRDDPRVRARRPAPPAVDRSGAAHRPPAAQPAADDEVDAQRRRPPPVPTRHQPPARVHLRRCRPPHAGGARLRGPGPGGRLAPGGA